MIFLSSAISEAVDITNYIPLKYKLIFIIVFAVVATLVYRWLSKLFLPQGDETEAPIWSSKSKK
ncbi:MAG: hypothetical protein RR253_00810 [Oscillospiraceae bacterium]